jgi:hypothetical protein
MSTSATGSIKSVQLPSHSIFARKIVWQHEQIAWKFLRVFTTTLILKEIRGPRLIVVPKGKKVKNWIISSQVPKLVMVRAWERFRE